MFPKTSSFRAKKILLKIWSFTRPLELEVPVVLVRSLKLHILLVVPVRLVFQILPAGKSTLKLQILARDLVHRKSFYSISVWIHANI